MTTKLFLTICLVAALIVAFVAAATAYNMRSGFSRYLAEAELSRFDQLHDNLVAAHDSERPGWPQFKDNMRDWRRFTRAVIPRPGPPPRGQRPPPRDGRPSRPPNRDGRPSRPPPDPMLFGIRLTLLDSAGNRVVGGNPELDIIARRPIVDFLIEGDSPPLGWIGLTANQRGISGTDALFLRDQLWTLLATSLLALAISGTAAFFLARQFLKPVRDLAEAGDRLSAGDYGIRLDARREDELGALLHQFNRLAESLETRDKVERKWISDTSHELKTPLAILRAQIEAIQDGVHKPDARRLNELHESTMRLSKLVADLNALSNMREGHLSTFKQQEDLVDIITSRLDNTLDHVASKELSVETHLGKSLLVECDRLRIGQLLDNLLQNSARYTDAPGRIQVTAQDAGDNVVVRVEDTSPCPDSALHDQLFDRFFREESSRDRKYGGSGLGLAICREIVSAHHGTITATSSPLGGLCITFTLPKKQPDHD